jgi:hygromycin-B 7''-O-kinase
MASALTCRLPSPIEPAEFDERYRSSLDEWLEAAREQCARCGLPDEPCRPFEDGSNLVVAVGERRVLKLFPPFHHHQWESERQVLPRFFRQLPVAVPELLAEGERDDGWSFVLMTRLPGASLEALWPALDRPARLSLLEAIGITMASAHALPVGTLRELPPRWGSFLEQQRAGCLEHHRKLGAPGWLQRDLDAYLDQAWPQLTAPTEHVILTGEYTPFNLLGELTRGGCRLTGMIDLGDAMIGPPLYDLLGPCAFLAGGERDHVAALLRGYGARELTPPLRHHLMALLLLHRYSNLNAQVRIADWRTRAGSIASLAELIWPP